MKHYYYHAMLEQSFPARIVRQTKTRIIFDLINAPAGVQVRRSCTHKQAAQFLSKEPRS